MTTRAWRWLLGSVLGLNLVSAALGKDTICCTIREAAHLERPGGARRLLIRVGLFLAWFLPHLLNPAKRPRGGRP